jgi:6-phospho-3-hexuloisomerase
VQFSLTMGENLTFFPRPKGHAMTLAPDARAAALEIAAASGAVDPAQLDALLTALTTARRIVCHGLGREGLMMRALAMRLYHAGLDVHMQGDMTCPPVGPGDLFLISAGPGSFGTLDALCAIARTAGAQVACITAQPQGSTARNANLLLLIPAQTMANDQGPDRSILPMGSLYEGAMFLTFELLILRLIARLGTSAAALRARHTNLE